MHRGRFRRVGGRQRARSPQRRPIVRSINVGNRDLQLAKRGNPPSGGCTCLPGEQEKF